MELKLRRKQVIKFKDAINSCEEIKLVEDVVKQFGGKFISAWARGGSRSNTMVFPFNHHVDMDKLEQELIKAIQLGKEQARIEHEKSEKEYAAMAAVGDEISKRLEAEGKEVKIIWSVNINEAPSADAIAVEGEVNIKQEYYSCEGNLWYFTLRLMNPTWYDIAKAFNDYMQVADTDHVFLEGFRKVGDVYEFCTGS